MVSRLCVWFPHHRFADPLRVRFPGFPWPGLGLPLGDRRRMIDHGEAAVQQFGEDWLPLILLFAVSMAGLMLTARYTWMKGYAYDFLAILHALTVIRTLTQPGQPAPDYSAKVSLPDKIGRAHV